MRSSSVWWLAALGALALGAWLYILGLDSERGEAGRSSPQAASPERLELDQEARSSAGTALQAGLEARPTESKAAAAEERQPLFAKRDSEAQAWVVEGRAFRGREDAQPGARVLIQMFAGIDSESQLLREELLVSDAAGRFRWPLAPPAEAVTLRASAAPEPEGDPREYESYGSSTSVARHGQAPKDLRVHFYAFDLTLVGRVTDEHREPLVGASVRMGSRVVLTDGRGEYRIPSSSLRPRVVLYAEAEGYAQKRAIAQIEDARLEQRVDFELSAALQARGRVLDEGGLPIAAALVTSFMTQGNSVESAADGSFILDHLDPASTRHFLHASKAGYVEDSSTLTTPEIRAGELELVLRRGSRVQGVVLGPDGLPLAGAALFIGDSPHHYNRLDAHSDGDGAFEFPNVGAGRQVLSAQYSGFAQAVQVIEVPATSHSSLSVSIQILEGHYLAGIVTDQEQLPLEGIWVSGKQDREYIEASAKTDAEGRFRIEGLPGNGVGLEFFGNDVVRLDHEYAELDRDDLAVIMVRAGRVGGRVLDALTQEPLDSFVVRFFFPELGEGEVSVGGYSSTWGREGRRFSGADGYWESGDEEFNPGGVIGVEVLAEGYGTLVNPHVVARVDFDPDALVFPLQRASSLWGHVLDADGLGLPNCSVTWEPAAAGYRAQYEPQFQSNLAQTDERGTFRIENASPQEGRLWIKTPDRTAFADEPFLLAPGVSVERAIRVPLGARIEGLVLDIEGQPEAGVAISVRATAVQNSAGFQREVLSDELGEFRFEGLAAGSYQVSRLKKSGDFQVPELSAACTLESEGLTRLELKFEGAGRLGGQLELDGAPFMGVVQVFARLMFDGQGNPQSSPAKVRGTLAENGRFEILGLAPGSYMLTAHRFERSGRLVGELEFVLSANQSRETVLELKQTP